MTFFPKILNFRYYFTRMNLSKSWVEALNLFLPDFVNLISPACEMCIFMKCKWHLIDFEREYKWRCLPLCCIMWNICIEISSQMGTFICWLIQYFIHSSFLFCWLIFWRLTGIWFEIFREIETVNFLTLIQTNEFVVKPSYRNFVIVISDVFWGDICFVSGS